MSSHTHELAQYPTPALPALVTTPRFSNRQAPITAGPVGNALWIKITM